MDQTDLSLFKRKTDKNEKTDNICHEVNSNTSSKLKHHEKHRIISRPTRENEYHTDNPHVGIALIFNYKSNAGERQRDESEKDRDVMEQTLLNYGFDVRVFNNITFQELYNILWETAAEDHSNNDCLVVTVISNGDGLYPVDFLWNSFLGEKCKTLINKPKLFFLQVSRGQDKHVSFLKKSIQFMQPKPKLADNHNIPYVIPNTADILIMFSTFEKHGFIRNAKNDSSFIQSLCSVLNDAAANEAVSEKGAELLRLLTAVNRKVAYGDQSFSECKVLDKDKEMSNFLSTLTKTFYLRVKNRNN